MKKITLVFAAALIALTSCMENFLDVRPMGKFIPEKASDFENLLNNDRTIEFQFMDNNRGCETSFLDDNYQITQAMSDERYGVGMVNQERYAAYVFYNPIFDPHEPDAIYTNIFKAMNLFNTVIEGIEGCPEEERDSDIGKKLIAQAKAARAWSYMNAAFVWGPMYNPGAANDAKAFPYRKSSDPTVNEDLHTTAQMMEYLKQDLEESLVGAPDNVLNPTRANKAAVYALLAQYYMYQRDWQKMYENASASWNASLAVKGGADNMLYNYNDFQYIPESVTVPSGQDPETMMSIGYFPGGVYAPGDNFNKSYSKENLFYRVGTFSHGEDYMLSDDYLSIFDFDTDRRAQLFILKVVGYGDEIQYSNYREDKFGQASTMGITYSEVLLMKAEAAARLGNKGEALDALNTLRAYRYIPSAAKLEGGEAMTQDELLNEILTERRREMPVGTIQRVIDLKRYQYDAGKPWSKSEIRHTIGNQVYKANITDPVFNKTFSNVIIRYNPHWGLTEETKEYRPK